MSDFLIEPVSKLDIMIDIPLEDIPANLPTVRQAQAGPLTTCGHDKLLQFNFEIGSSLFGMLCSFLFWIVKQIGTTISLKDPSEFARPAEIMVVIMGITSTVCMFWN